MRNVYNFSAGPAVLPEPVLQEAADEMPDYSSLFQTIIDETGKDLRTLKKLVRIGKPRELSPAQKEKNLCKRQNRLKNYGFESIIEKYLSG